jgi:hypothetical protein
VKSELPGERASERLTGQAHAISAAVGGYVSLAAEIVVNVLQPTQKISGEGVFHATANRKGVKVVVVMPSMKVRSATPSPPVAKNSY